MSDLFDRVAVVEVGAPGEAGIRIDSRGAGDAPEGLRVVFDVVKTITSDVNKASIKVYNLTPARRLGLVKGHVLRLWVGYRDVVELIYEGDVTRVESARSGGDWITTLECGDGVETFRTQDVKQTFAAGTKVIDVIRKVAEQFTVAIPDPKRTVVWFGPPKSEKKTKASRLSLSSLTQDLAGLETSLKAQGFATTLRRALSVSGNAREVMDRLAIVWRFRWSVQNGALQVVSLDRALAGEAVLLSSETGLTGAPRVTESGVIATALVIPQLRPGGGVILRSETITGVYVLERVDFRGDTRGGGEATIEARSLAGAPLDVSASEAAAAQSTERVTGPVDSIRAAGQTAGVL